MTVIYGHCTTRENDELNPAKFMMHLPIGDMGQGGTADEIEVFSKRVREEEDKLCKFYSELMGFDKETIKSLISTDTYLTTEQMRAFGITTKEPTKIVAKAYFNSNTNKQMSNLTEEDKGFISKLFDKILNKEKSTIVNKILQDANGADIDFADVEDDGTPVVGDKAVVDGADAEGDYLMPNGETLVFVAGELTEIKAVEEGADEEMEALKKTTEEQAVTIEALTAEKVVLEENISNMKKDVKELKSTITSKLEIGKTENKKEDKAVVNNANSALENLRKKRK